MLVQREMANTCASSNRLPSSVQELRRRLAVCRTRVVRAHVEHRRANDTECTDAQKRNIELRGPNTVTFFVELYSVSKQAYILNTRKQFKKIRPKHARLFDSELSPRHEDGDDKSNGV
jgi:hypothetical protein